MNRLLAAILLTCLLSARAAADMTQPVVQISQFPGNRPAAIAYTFDDNLRDQYTLAAPMLNEVGFKATFFVIAGKTAETPEEGAQKKEDGNAKNLFGGISWPELKALSDQGHEIASHTWSHAGLTKLSPEELHDQLSKACQAIQSHIGKPALTLAFPGNGSNEAVQAAALKYHVAYRSYQQSTSGKSTVESLNAWADKQIKEKKFGILMIHGISIGYAAMTDPEILRQHFKYVKSIQADIWVDTFANISRYIKERDDAKLTVVEGKQSLVCTLTGTLDSKLYDVPLTLIINVPSVKTATAKRNGKLLHVSINKDTILIEALPDPLPIQIDWTTATAN